MYVERYLALADISRKLNIEISTLELWCDRYNWDARRVAHGITPHELNRMYLRTASRVMQQVNEPGAEPSLKDLKELAQMERIIKAGNPNAPTLNIVLSGFLNG